jgi:acetyl-CoA acetyltransferase family protein
MSRAPWSVPKTERAFPWGNVTMYDTTIGWRYPNPRMEEVIPLEGMGQTAENIYDETGISREEQDAFALESQRRAAAAIEAGRFRDEIVPVPVPQRRGPPVLVDTDEHPRIEIDADGKVRLTTSAEGLAKLRPAFRSGGTVTAGSSSGINDGAAALLLMSEEKAEELGLEPLARWVVSAVAGVSPRTMGYGPIPATRKVLERTGLSVDDMDLVELNEAFAIQALACIKALGLDMSKTNVNGGAVALGHPLGCTGARLMVTLLHEMQRRAAAGERMRYGLATMCVGIGQGCATLVERPA